MRKFTGDAFGDLLPQAVVIALMAGLIAAVELTPFCAEDAFLIAARQIGAPTPGRGKFEGAGAISPEICGM